MIRPKPQTSTGGSGARKPTRTAVGTAEPRRPGPSKEEIAEAIREMDVRELIGLQSELRRALSNRRRGR